MGLRYTCFRRAEHTKWLAYSAESMRLTHRVQTALGLPAVREAWLVTSGRRLGVAGAASARSVSRRRWSRGRSGDLRISREKFHAARPPSGRLSAGRRPRVRRARAAEPGPRASRGVLPNELNLVVLKCAARPPRPTPASQRDIHISPNSPSLRAAQLPLPPLQRPT